MARTISQVLDLIGSIIPWSKAGGWDPVGLQLGDPSAPIETVAVCHEVNEAVMATLDDDPADLLVSYHPLLFKASNRMVKGRSATGRAFRLIEQRTALAVVHTAFDVAEGGTADALAEAVGIVDSQGFGAMTGPDTVKIWTFLPPNAVDVVADALVKAGGGLIGRYSHCSFRSDGVGTFLPLPGTDPVTGRPDQFNKEEEIKLEMIVPRHLEGAAIAALVAAHPYQEPAFDVVDTRSNHGMIGRWGQLPEPQPLNELAGLVATKLGSPGNPLAGTRWSGGSNMVVRSAAVVPGSGSSYLSEAAATGCDVLITGDVTHHRAVEARERGICVIDPGHEPTERPGMHRLVQAIEQVFGPIRNLTHLNTNPWEH